MRKKTPQEKKSLSYAKDRRNTYGENDKGSRKNIPLRKAKVNRGYRRKVDELLRSANTGVGSEEPEFLECKVRNLKRENWKKAPDEPLGSVVKRKLERRVAHGGNGKTARKKVREFVANLVIETELEIDGRWIVEAKDLNGVIVYGETEEDAVWQCKHLAGLVYLQSLGAIRINEVDNNYTSVDVN